MAADIGTPSPSILVLGDSLSAAYGIPDERGWVRLLDQRLEQSGCNYRIVNASVSGDTSHAALSRLDPILERGTPAVAVIELGANDGLRGIHPDEMQKNLASIIEKLRDVDTSIVLVPMKMPPNYGSAFTEKFEAVYTLLAEKYDLMLSRFILADIANHPEMMQDDGLHPTASAQRRMLDNVWDALASAASGHQPEDGTRCPL